MNSIESDGREQNRERGWFRTMDRRPTKGRLLRDAMDGMRCEEWGGSASVCVCSARRVLIFQFPPLLLLSLFLDFFHTRIPMRMATIKSRIMMHLHVKALLDRFSASSSSFTPPLV